jgi:hypothetical protein
MAEGSFRGKTIREANQTSYLPDFLKFPLLRRTLKLPDVPNPDLTVRPVRSLEELTLALKTVHDVFVSQGLLSEKPSGMKITKYHLLPSTTVVAAFLDEKIVGVVTLVRNGAFSTPSLPYLDPTSGFFIHDRYLEPIDFAIVPDHRETNSHEILFAICKFILHFAPAYQDCTAVLVNANPRLMEFIRGVLILDEIPKSPQSHLRPLPKYNVFAYVDLPEIFKKLYLVYRNTEPKRNLYKYLRGSDSRFRTTTGVAGSIDNFVLGPKNVSVLLEKATFFANALSLEEKLRLLSVHGWPLGWESLVHLPNIAGVEVFNVRRERRFETNLDGVLAEREDQKYWKGVAVKILDLSRKGCRLTLSRSDIALPKPVLKIQIDSQVFCQVQLELQRRYSDGNAGYRIVGVDSTFEEYVGRLDDESDTQELQPLSSPAEKQAS